MPKPLRLVLLSALMLFVELALIRWTGSNIIFLSYFSNFVLLGSFLGIGIGFLRGRARVNLFPWAPVALAFFVGLVLIFPVQIDRSGGDLIFFGGFQMTGLPVWITLPVIFLAVAGIMEMIAEGVARTFVEFAPLEAYRYDIGGSIVGIVAFSLLSFTWAPPVAWGAAVALLFAVLMRFKMRPLQWVAIIGLVLMLGRESAIPLYSWSPYYKITTIPFPNEAPGSAQINVNGIPHQKIATVAERRQEAPYYFIPYERTRVGSLDNVLIVGAGTGTDVAIGLSEGAKHIDAVEIDPRLQQIGAQQHPNHPYQDPRVSVHIDDGRAFLERTNTKYDLILFALPDSLTLVSGQSSLRLESYLFTLQAMQTAKAHLKPTGAFAMYNYYREDWLVDRLAGTLQSTYGHAPCVYATGTDINHLAVLTVAPIANHAICTSAWHASDPAAGASSSTDDYPFLYLRTPGVPPIYQITLALILLASVVAVRWISGPFRRMGSYLDLFFMGSAFLLLETKSVVQFALLFGTTWFVNALVFAGVLVAVLLAIEVSRRVRLPKPIYLYGLLLAALVLAWLIPPDSLLGLVAAPRFAVAVAVYFAPIFLANLVFAERFRNVEESNVAFGANLLGAMVGGVLEYLALITGYQALLIVVAVLYGLAFASRFLTMPAWAQLHIGTRNPAASPD